jgi:hypothetical protein
MDHPSPHRVGSRRLALLLVTLLGLAASLQTVGRSSLAGTTDLPGTIPKAPRFLAGFPIPFPRTVDFRPRQGSVVAADIDRDGRKDLVVSVPSGQVLVLRQDGTRAPGWPRTFDNLTQPAMPVGDPAVGDLDGDGSPEIVTCVVSGTPMRRNFLYALRADGTDLPGFPIELRDTSSDYFTCSNIPTLAVDLNGDGRLEIIRGMNKGTLMGFDNTGLPLPGWPVRLGLDPQGRVREINADLAVADLNGDGRQELVFVESALAPRLAAVSFDGQLLPGFPKWLHEMVDRQAPAVGDLDGDGRPEVVQGTMPYQGDLLEPQASPELGPAVPAALHVLRGDGSSAPGWPQPLQNGAPSGSILADLDGNGRLEVLSEDGDNLDGFDAWGAQLQGFPVKVHRDFVKSQSTEISPWFLEDLNGDGRRDLLQIWSNLYAGSSYLRVFGLRASGNAIRGFPFDADGMLACSHPVLSDFSGDGINDLVILIADGGNGGWILAGWDLGSAGRIIR